MTRPEPGARIESTTAHLQLGKPHRELDMLHGLELLNLECCFQLRSTDGDVELLQCRELGAGRTQYHKNSRSVELHYLGLAGPTGRAPSVDQKSPLLPTDTYNTHTSVTRLGEYTSVTSTPRRIADNTRKLPISASTSTLDFFAGATIDGLPISLSGRS